MRSVQRPVRATRHSLPEVMSALLAPFALAAVLASGSCCRRPKGTYQEISGTSFSAAAEVSGTVARPEGNSIVKSIGYECRRAWLTFFIRYERIVEPIRPVLRQTFARLDGLQSFTAPDRRSRPPIPCADPSDPPGYPTGRVLLCARGTCACLLRRNEKWSPPKNSPKAIGNQSQGPYRDTFPDRRVFEGEACNADVRPYGAPMIDGPAHRQFRRITQKWRTLIERQRDHLAELYRTERWKRYYTEEEFVLRTRTMRRLVDLWTEACAEPKRRRTAIRYAAAGCGRRQSRSERDLISACSGKSGTGFPIRTCATQ